MEVVILSKSTRKEKKWQIKFKNGKVVHFGAEGYLDYTQHGDPKRKELYIQRHEATGNEQWGNIQTAGFWSRWLLWEEPSIQSAINKIEKKFKIKIIYKK